MNDMLTHVLISATGTRCGLAPWSKTNPGGWLLAVAGRRGATCQACLHTNREAQS